MGELLFAEVAAGPLVGMVVGIAVIGFEGLAAEVVIEFVMARWIGFKSGVELWTMELEVFVIAMAAEQEATIWTYLAALFQLARYLEELIPFQSLHRALWRDRWCQVEGVQYLCLGLVSIKTDLE